MNGHQKLRFYSKILATVLVFVQRYYFGPVGAGAGAVDAVIMYAIWNNHLNWK